MVFKRRDPRTYSQMARDFVYPKGGFRRAIHYVLHRMRRLPDQPHRIARGIFAGTFVNFPPVYGVQMLSAAALAWVLRGNIIAALLATFLSNPLTTPFIAMGSLKLGHWMLGIEAPMTFMSVYAAFTDAGGQLWHNFRAAFTDDVAQWDKLIDFFWFIFWPYTIGAIIPGLVASFIAYYLSLPLIHAYQKLRSARLREKSEKRKALKARLASVAKGIVPTRENGDDDPPGAA
ncbi:DUF2062 domain-containing protein [Gemmobacter fulvus]|uniref:DUF2062 domain-containing protein n=1 Tax=Gemmobacter fulvus TaxID=2840474 RepID=A0A975S0Y8_9RHOB|nr:DUF2062 domain-containing protein [Gemmobacter fulvus]MBT9245651.1 DUF2062 domain-containing protein [Gemmobacter fulvus]QWK89495.1 DUF2062 domain-containing protein [Gemmobacter fulvus]